MSLTTDSEPGRVTGWASGVAAAVSYGVTPIVAVSAFSSGVSSLTLVTLRGLLGAAAILGFCAVTGRLRRLPVGACIGLLACSGPLFGAQISAYFAAVDVAGAQLAVVVTHIYPVFVIALVWLRTRRPVPRSLLLLCPILGVGIVLVAGAGVGQVSIGGVVLAASSAAGYALYFVMSERWVHQTGAVVAAGLVSVGSAVSTGAAAIVTGESFAVSVDGWIAIAIHGLLLMPIGLCGTMFAIRALGSIPMSMLGLLEPVTAILLAAMLLNEQLSGLQWLGVGVVLAACAALPMVTRTYQQRIHTWPTAAELVAVAVPHAPADGAGARGSPECNSPFETLDTPNRNH